MTVEFPNQELSLYPLHGKIAHPRFLDVMFPTDNATEIGGLLIMNTYICPYTEFSEGKKRYRHMHFVQIKARKRMLHNNYCSILSAFHCYIMEVYINSYVWNSFAFSFWWNFICILSQLSFCVLSHLCFSAFVFCFRDCKGMTSSRRSE